jgi:SAM-dependent methyltransferase
MPAGKDRAFMEFRNSYEDAQRAEAYAKLEFPGTYYLAYRDLPQIISEHVGGRKALDFGCGTGRSTRFLKKLGFETVGVDISANMLRLAQAQDPDGEYLLIENTGLSMLGIKAYDLILSAFTFDNIPTMVEKVARFKELGDLLERKGRIINLVSSPEIYTNEWVSFTTRDFPENRHARNGDRVRIIITDVEDGRPVEDILWTDEAYREVYRQAGLRLIGMYKPLAGDREHCKWVNETRIAPWIIYISKKQDS